MGAFWDPRLRQDQADRQRHPLRAITLGDDPEPISMNRSGSRASQTRGASVDGRLREVPRGRSLLLFLHGQQGRVRLAPEQAGRQDGAPKAHSPSSNFLTTNDSEKGSARGVPNSCRRWTWVSLLPRTRSPKAVAAADSWQGSHQHDRRHTSIPKDLRKNDNVDNKRRRQKLRSLVLTIRAAALFVKEGAAQMDSESPLPAAGPSALHGYTIVGMAS
jgi:hypothetical protein